MAVTWAHLIVIVLKKLLGLVLEYERVKKNRTLDSENQKIKEQMFADMFDDAFEVGHRDFLDKIITLKRRHST